MDLREIGWGSVQWIQLVQVAGSWERGDEPSGSGATELGLPELEESFHDFAEYKSYTQRDTKSNLSRETKI
jgi:hypothetical protein